ncbi:MAG: hypothetical protein ACI8PZ_005357 [Myxococcota bacterium]|jgi:hypothetical protein
MRRRGGYLTGVLGVTVLAGLACGGVEELSDLIPAALEAEDPIVGIIANGDYPMAEAFLNRRFAEDPRDREAFLLLGDLNFRRGQDFNLKWKENLQRAQQAYMEGVRLDPRDCSAWTRLGVAVVAAATNPEIRVSPQDLAGLPVSAGWSACPGSGAILALEDQRTPLEVLENPDAREGDIVAKQRPYMVRWYESLGLSELTWKGSFRRERPDDGSLFVVLETPTTARGLGGAGGRTFTAPETVRISGRSGSEVTYNDRRSVATKPGIGKVLATACPGTKWEAGSDGFPSGYCQGVPYDGRFSPIYEPSLLQPTGHAFYEVSPAKGATIDRDGIVPGSVRCLHGPVERMIVDTPTCGVVYSVPIPVRRAIPTDAGLVAHSYEHADGMVRAKAMGAVWGDDAAARVAKGEVANGLPFPLFLASQPDLTGCKGRGVFTRATFDDDTARFTCTMNGTVYTFEDLVLVEQARAPR